MSHLRFYDGNFFMGRDRLLDTGRLIVDSDLRGSFQWSATGVARRLVKLDSEVLDLLRRAGCHQVAIGAESGSEELLGQITNKTTVEETTEAVRLLTRHGINQYLFFMVAYPDEPDEAMEDTLRLMAKLKSINPEVEMSANFVIPLPGSHAFRVAVQKGVLVAPESFGDWARFDYHQSSLTNASAAYANNVARFFDYLSLAYPRGSSFLQRLADSNVGRLLYSPIRSTALWRIESNTFRFPIEAWLFRTVRDLRSARPGA